MHDLRIERAADIIGHPKIVGAADLLRGRVGRDHDHRDVPDDPPPFHLLQHGIAVHHRHEQIEQHQRDPGAVALQRPQPLFAVGGLQDPVAVTQHLRQDLAVERRIIHDQDHRHVAVCRIVRRRRLFAVTDPRHHGVFVLFGAVHQPVGTRHGIGRAFVLHRDPADAGRQAKIVIAGHRDLAHLHAYRLQRIDKTLLRHAGHQQ